MGNRSISVALWSLLLGIGTAQAQDRAALLNEARFLANQEPRQSLALLRRILAVDSLDYEANWRSTTDLVAIGQETPDSIKSSARDSLYFEAEALARRAVRSDSTKPDGYFALGMSLGRVALTKSKKDRVRYAREIYDAATRALTIAPDHDGAHHILALWHAEAMRTSGFNRFMAKNLLGGKILGQASWSKAIDHLEAAVRIDSTRIFHRLDLARVYVDRKQFSLARTQLNRIGDLPNRVALDPEYRRQGAILLQRIAEKRDGGD